ncbi:MAG: hypothetical protein JNM93_08095 [Bacteriovoracaceae bacterium]|nr:hypothetical protein [Bacteriovoracaceae bacterium]
MMLPVVKEPTGTAIDRYQLYASSKILNLSSSVDYFFGGIRVDDESNGTYARLTFDNLIKERDGYTLTPTVRIRMDLPGTRQKMKLVLDDDDDSANRNTQTSGITTRDRSRGFNASLRFVIDQKSKWNLSTDLGVRMRSSPWLNPFVRLRGRRSFLLTENLEMRFIQELYEFLETGAETRSTLDFDYPLGSNMLFRFGNNAIWTDELDYFTYSNGPSLYKKLSHKRALGIHARASGDNSNGSTYTNYELFVSYRQLIYKDWIFAELTPGLSYPKALDFQQVAFIKISIQSLFGNF